MTNRVGCDTRYISDCKQIPFTSWKHHKLIYAAVYQGSSWADNITPVQNTLFVSLFEMALWSRSKPLRV